MLARLGFHKHDRDGFVALVTRYTESKKKISTPALLATRGFFATLHYTRRLLFPPGESQRFLSSHGYTGIKCVNAKCAKKKVRTAREIYRIEYRELSTTPSPRGVCRTVVHRPNRLVNTREPQCTVGESDSCVFRRGLPIREPPTGLRLRAAFARRRAPCFTLVGSRRSSGRRLLV